MRKKCSPPFVDVEFETLKLFASRRWVIGGVGSPAALVLNTELCPVPLDRLLFGTLLLDPLLKLSLRADILLSVHRELAPTALPPLSTCSSHTCCREYIPGNVTTHQSLLPKLCEHFKLPRNASTRLATPLIALRKI